MTGRWLETLYLWKEHRTVFGTTSWRRTFESLRVAFSHVSHHFTLVLAFLGSLLVGVVGSLCWVCVFVFVFVLGGSPRCRDVVVFFPTS